MSSLLGFDQIKYDDVVNETILSYLIRVLLPLLTAKPVSFLLLVKACLTSVKQGYSERKHNKNKQ
jgi:hypothetical protein